MLSASLFGRELLDDKPEVLLERFKLEHGGERELDERGSKPTYVFTLPGDRELKEKLDEFRKQVDGDEKPDSWVIEQIGTSGDVLNVGITEKIPEDWEGNLYVEVEINSGNRNCGWLGGVLAITADETVYNKTIRFYKKGGDVEWKDFAKDLERGRPQTMAFTVKMPEGKHRFASLVFFHERKDVAEDSVLEIQTMRMSETEDEPDAVLVKSKK